MTSADQILADPAPVGLITTDRFKGRLGFSARSETLLNQGLVQAVDMLDDYGHPPEQINTRAKGRIELDSDQYRVVLRLRRLPLRMGVRIPEGIPAPAIFLDVTIERHHPQASDAEITELLLAVLLRRLTEALLPVLVFWQDAPKAMSRDEFLGVFARHDARQAENSVTRSVLSRPAPSEKPARKARPARPRAAFETGQIPSPFAALPKPRRGRKLFSDSAMADRSLRSDAVRSSAVFSPVDSMADDLERRCARQTGGIAPPADQVIDLHELPVQDRSAQRQHIMSWAATGLIAMLSAPVAVLLLLVELMRGSQMRPGTQILSAALFIGLLQSAGMVQAAARVWMLPHP